MKWYGNPACESTMGEPVPPMAARIFLTCWILYTLHWAPFIVREHFPAATLAESGSLDVSRFLGWTIDIFATPDGRAHINNNPGASVLGAIPLTLARPLLHRAAFAGRDLPAPPTDSDDTVLRSAIRDGLLTYMLAVSFLTLALLSAPLTALSAALLYARLEASGIPQSRATLAAFAFAFGTPVFFRTGYLNHNLIVCHLGLIAFLILWQQSLTTPRLLAAGALAGYALFCDFTGALTILALACILLFRGWRPALIFCFAALPGAVALLAVQWSVFGNPLLPSQHYMTPIDVTTHGYRGFTGPSPALLWALLFRPTFGLFSWCPILLLSLAAPFVKRVPYRAPAPLQALVLGYFALCLLFSSCNQYTWLQWNTGFRYLVPVVPGLLLLSLHTLQALPKWVAALFLLSSLLQSWSVAMTWRLHALDSVVRVLSQGPSFPWLSLFRRWHWLEPSSPGAWLPPAAALCLLCLIWLPRLRKSS